MACRAVWSYSWHNRNSKTNWSISWPLALAGPGLALGSHFMWGSAFNAIIVPLFEFYFRLGGWRHAGTELLLLRWISPSCREMNRNKHPHNTTSRKSWKDDSRNAMHGMEQQRYLEALFAAVSYVRWSPSIFHICISSNKWCCNLLAGDKDPT